MVSKNLTYKKSGVNITAADNFVKFISQLNTNKKGKKKFENIGGFGSITSIPKKFKNPQLVACTDGVGTKIENCNHAGGDFKHVGRVCDTTQHIPPPQTHTFTDKPHIAKHA